MEFLNSFHLPDNVRAAYAIIGIGCRKYLCSQGSQKFLQEKLAQWDKAYKDTVTFPLNLQQRNLVCL